MDLALLRQAFGSGTQEEIVEACHQIAPRIIDYEEAKSFIWAIVSSLLEKRMYRAAAHLLWGSEMFDPRPESVDRLLKAIESQSKTIVLGAGSLGKSYSIIAYLLLDWLRDPEFTGARIISTTSAHALANTFSTLQRFYDEAIIPLPGFSQHGFIGLDAKDRHASLSIIAIKVGDTGKNSLQGFHPIRRKTPHPAFGNLSRIRLFLDEAELIPNGVWKGVYNLLGNLSGTETVKAICATNPWDVTSVLAMAAEPPQGYSSINADTDKAWVSKSGWNVIRIDAADSENVVQRKVVYPGLMTYEGYELYRSKTDGNDPEYWCYARGMYPTQGSIDCLIPLSFLEGAIGSWILSPGYTVAVGGIDLAFEGDDDVIFFAGRYGKASSWRAPGPEGQVMPLEEPRFVLQVDNFFNLPKGRTEMQYLQCRKLAQDLGIGWEWLALDKTGIGKGVADLFVERGQRGVLEIGWGTAATHTKILDEDRSFCDEVCDGVSYEMYATLRAWLEFEFIKFDPHIDMSKLQKEIIGRKRIRSKLGSTGEVMYKLEQKEAFKSRYGFSPDRADALVMMLHVARIRGPERARMAKRKRSDLVAASQAHDPLSMVQFMDFSQEDSL
jgi:hypothetical protein